MLQETSSRPLKDKTAIGEWVTCLPKTSRPVLFSSFESPFFPHHDFWALLEPSPCSSRLKTAAIRWQLWTFHLPTISRWSESSVCLSKTFSVFNLDCSSGCLSLAQPAAVVSSHQLGFYKMWEILMKGMFGATGLVLQSLNLRTYRGLNGGESFRQINHLWIYSFSTTYLGRESERHTEGKKWA